MGAIGFEAEHELGLRERKKQRTRETIARVALGLFSRQGFHETTIKQIADAADVSPRTVSAYFPAKEDLAFAGHEVAFDALERRLAERRDGETVADGLRDWLGLMVSDEPAERERRRQLRAIVEADPALRTYERGLMERVEEIIAAAVAVDLELGPDDLLPRMVGAATIAALDALGREAKSRHRGGDEALRHEALALLDDAMTFIGAGVQGLATRRGVGRATGR
jgi:AcrR family transcriptional regulator